MYHFWNIIGFYITGNKYTYTQRGRLMKRHERSIERRSTDVSEAAELEDDDVIEQCRCTAGRTVCVCV